MINYAWREALSACLIPSLKGFLFCYKLMLTGKTKFDTFFWRLSKFRKSQCLEAHPCCFLALAVLACVSQARAVARFLAAINAKFSHLTTCGSQTFAEDLILSESLAKSTQEKFVSAPLQMLQTRIFINLCKKFHLLGLLRLPAPIFTN